MRSEAEIREARELMLVGWRRARTKAARDVYAHCGGVLLWAMGKESAFGIFLDSVKAEVAKESNAE